MKSQKFKRIIVLLLVTAMAVAIPGSFAKYVGSVQVTKMAVKKKIAWFFNTGTSLDGQIITLPYAGSYAVIVKGGDGSDGYVWNNTERSKNNEDVSGGIGGTVVGVYVAKQANQILYVAPGGAGSRPRQVYESMFSGTVGRYGYAGTNNGESIFNGGKGADVTDLPLAKYMSKMPSSGGGGAASVIYECDSNGNKTNLLFVAGGGGSAGSWNELYEKGIWLAVCTVDSIASGKGGDGASNYANGKTNSVDYAYTIEDGKFVKHLIIPGLDGTGANNTLGKGGRGVPGRTATVESACSGWMEAGSAQRGSAIFVDKSGVGGNGCFYGGGGGGGFCGGGGGAGASLDNIPAGGGGGGSSYMSDVIVQDLDIEYSSIINDAMDESKCDKINGKIPVQNSSVGTSEDSDGYIIIKYLGEGGTPGESPANNTKSLSSVMTDIVNACSSYKSKTINNTTSSSDPMYSDVMNVPCASLLLEGRAWKIGTDKNGNATITFSEERSAAIVKSTRFWKYNNGTFSSATAKQSGSIITGYSYGYPSDSTWKVDNSFVLS